PDMDQERFDAALRALQAGTTRRAGLAGMVGVLLGGLNASVAQGSGARANREGFETQGPCGDGGQKANTCRKDSKCCTDYCAGGVCRCKPNWMKCAKGAHCCSRVCASNGRCDGGTKPEGSSCREDFNCDDGLACISDKCVKSPKAKCKKQNCPGCCEGTTCRGGATTAACGANATVCLRCTRGSTCINGACLSTSPCTAATCPNGCCQNGTCKAGTQDSACGTGGAACAACSGGKTCQARRCQAGGGCSAASCPNGCCQNGTCKPGTQSDACGTGGAACAACSGTTPYCAAGVCAPPAWAYQTQMGTGGQGSGADELWSPRGVWVDADGLTAWITDSANNRVVVWTRPDANSTTWTYQTQLGTGTAGSGTNQFKGPYGVFVSADRLTAYIADSNNHRVVVWTRPDASSTSWAYETQMGTGTPGSGNTQFTEPVRVFVSADGLTAYMADWGNNRIAIWTRPDANSLNWAYHSQMGTGTSGSTQTTFDQPFGVRVSGDGLTAWIADTYNKRIAVWTRPDAGSTAWAYQTQLGTGTWGSGNNEFALPQGVWVSADTLTAWVADTFNSRIMIWTRPNAASTTWAFQTKLGTGTGQSSNDSFNFPTDVFVSGDGLTAWVADNNNNRIAIWAPDGP
ncbi:MAG: hypothetical protein ACKOWF_11345, partial [Chloroflexota bacterium]